MSSNYGYEHINEAYARIDEALNNFRRVILTDGTYTAYVTKILGDPEDPTETCLTLVLGDHISTKYLESNRFGELKGVSLRDTKDYLIIGPDWYLAKWPCDCTECIALFGKYCSVANCRGPVCNGAKNSIKSAEDAANAYLNALALEKCFIPENGNAYPLCVGNGAVSCKTCCLYKDMQNEGGF